MQLREAAKVLGVHYQTAYAWVRQGVLPARKTGRGYEVSESDVSALAARGPRFRLSAEAIRDNALAISGLLNLKSFGAPIHPPQPASLAPVAAPAPTAAPAEASVAEPYHESKWKCSAPPSGLMVIGVVRR